MHEHDTQNTEHSLEYGFVYEKQWFVCMCSCLTVRLGGDPQGGGALSRSRVIVSDDSEAVALLWLQVGNSQLQRLRLRHIHWPLPDTGKHKKNTLNSFFVNYLLLTLFFICI